MKVNHFLTRMYLKQLIGKISGAISSLAKRHPGRQDELIEKFQYQRQLLYTGVSASGEVLEIKIEGEMIHQFLEIRLLLSFFHAGHATIELLQANTVIEHKLMPRIGDRISFRFHPGGSETILIL